MLDAFAVLFTQPYRTVFAARANIFEHKTLSRILTFRRVLPMYRIHGDTMLPEFLRDYVDATDSALEDLVRREPETPVLTDGLRYALGLDTTQSLYRGKRLRGVLCLLVAEGLGASRDQALPFALAIELLHQFLLVHDDLEDGDKSRRDRLAVWARFGVAHGINIGDFLAAKPYDDLWTREFGEQFRRSVFLTGGLPPETYAEYVIAALNKSGSVEAASRDRGRQYELMVKLKAIVKSL